MSGPLSGVRVVEVANWTFVPAAAAELADLGADVIKVEPPTGDPQRALRNFLNRSGEGPNPFTEIPNRGKRSVTCDLSTDAGQRALHAIVATADVFVTSYLAPIRRKLRMDVEDLRGVNPDIIYVRGSGWGADGPMADWGGFDMACGWATSGMAFKMTPDGAIEPLPQPPAFFDLQGANTLAGAVGIALFKRAHTGETSVVDVPLMHVGMWALGPDIVGAPYAGDVVGYGDRTKAPNPLINGYATKDGRWVYIVCLQPDRYWEEFCRVLGRPDLADDPRFADFEARYRHRTELVGELDAEFAALTLDEVRAKFAEFSGVWAPVLRPSELHEHPLVDVNGFLPHVTGRDGKEWRIVAAPMHFAGHATAPPGPAPEIGEHTEEVLLEVGLGWDAIGALRSGGALG
jgi:formyl-CoA transferase